MPLACHRGLPVRLTTTHTMSHNPSICAAYKERRKWLDRVIGLSLAVESSRANFSPGEDWTPTDDRVAYQISQIEASIIDASDHLTRASMAHRYALEEAELQAEAQRLAEE